jgi:hypothetical protein
MRLKSFAWFAVIVAVILLLLVAAQQHAGGSMAGWLPKLHGQR